MRPLEHIEVTSDFGFRLIEGTPDFHEGVDFVADESTPVFAMGDGVVEKAGLGVGGSGGGNAVAIIDDDDGRLFYLHLSRIEPSVLRGQRVVAGQRIGMAGRTGRVTGPHLHLQWQPDGVGGAVADIEPIVRELPAPSTLVTSAGSSGLGEALAAGAVGWGLFKLLKGRRR